MSNIVVRRKRKMSGKGRRSERGELNSIQGEKARVRGSVAGRMKCRERKNKKRGGGLPTIT